MSRFSPWLSFYICSPSCLAVEAPKCHVYAIRWRCQMSPQQYRALHDNVRQAKRYRSRRRKKSLASVRQSIYTRCNHDVMLKFKANAGYGTVKSVMNLGFRKGGEFIDRTFSGRITLLSLFRLYTFLSVRSLWNHPQNEQEDYMYYDTWHRLNL